MARGSSWTPRTARPSLNPSIQELASVARDIAGDLDALARYLSGESRRTVGLEQEAGWHDVVAVQLTSGVVSARPRGLFAGATVTSTGDIQIGNVLAEESLVVIACSYLGTAARANMYLTKRDATSATFSAYSNTDIKVNLAVGSHLLRVTLDRQRP